MDRFYATFFLKSYVNYEKRKNLSSISTSVKCTSLNYRFLNLLNIACEYLLILQQIKPLGLYLTVYCIIDIYKTFFEKEKLNIFKSF